MLPDSFCLPGSVAPLQRAALAFECESCSNHRKAKKSGLSYSELCRHWSPLSPHLSETSRKSYPVHFDDITTRLLSEALQRSGFSPENASEQEMRDIGRRWTFAAVGANLNVQDLFDYSLVVSVKYMLTSELIIEC